MVYGCENHWSSYFPAVELITRRQSEADQLKKAQEKTKKLKTAQEAAGTYEQTHWGISSMPWSYLDRWHLMYSPLKIALLMGEKRGGAPGSLRTMIVHDRDNSKMGGFHSLRGIPQNGWFISWRNLLKWMIWRYPDFRKPQYTVFVWM